MHSASSRVTTGERAVQGRESSFRVVHVSDTHLAATTYRRHGAPAAICRSNWSIVADEIRALSPNLLVHGGDILFEDPDDQASRLYARSELDRLGVRWRTVPGNHDVGDGPPDPVFGQTVSPERCDAHERTFDATPWVERHRDWTLIGINSQLFGTGWAAEDDQWAVLEDAASAHDGGSTALFMHKPPFLRRFDEPDASSAAVPPEARKRLRRLVETGPIRLIACGHRHEHRVCMWEQCAVVTAPSTAFSLHEGTPPFAGDAGFPGAIEYEFGARRLHWRLVAPDGLTRQDERFFAAAPSPRLADAIAGRT